MDSPYIHQFSASLFVIGSSSPPSELSKNLGVEPQHFFAKGSPRLNTYGTEVGAHAENLWGFDSPSLIDDPYIDAHVSYILNVIEPHASYLSNLPGPARLFLELTCSLEEPFLSTSFVIENSLLSRLNNLKISIGFVFRVVKDGCQ